MPAFLDSHLEAEIRHRAGTVARSGKPVRAWVAPCGSGALAYSVAIVLIETLGRRWRETPLRVLASDADAAAVVRARAGLFRRDDLPWLSPERRERFFTEEGGGLRVRRLLREVCLFTTDDAPPNAPRSPLDLVVTRDGLLAPREHAPEGEPQFRALLSQADEAVLVCDAETGAVVEANAAAESLYGRTRPDLLALRAEDLLAPSGARETLRLGVRKPKDREDFLRAIESQTARVAHLVDQLLDLSSAQRGRATLAPAPLPAAATVWDIAASFAPLARRRGVKLTLDLPAGLVVLADPSDFPHILGNLLDNAIKFSARGATVAVRGREEGGQALLSVLDAGPGVPPADLEKIFQRFYRSERTRAVKGTGLGLAIVRAMAKANGGRVWAENRDGGGTAFHVALPLAPVLQSQA